jgi:superfamily II DNA helicase RecQ
MILGRPPSKNVSVDPDFQPRWPFLLLTATLTKEILLSVCKKLHIEHPAIVAKFPERYLQHHTNYLSA